MWFISFIGLITTSLLASYGREHAFAIVTQSAQSMTNGHRRQSEEYRAFKHDAAGGRKGRRAVIDLIDPAP